MTYLEGATSAHPHARVAALLARYPRIQSTELHELKHWFRKEASALDVGTIASDPELAEPYRRFAADHVDKLTARDLVVAADLASLAIAVIVAIAMMA